jgi:hypothetical protein
MFGCSRVEPVLFIFEAGWQIRKDTLWCLDWLPRSFRGVEKLGHPEALDLFWVLPSKDMM